MPTGSTPPLCPGCREPEDDCFCWEEEQNAWDPRLLEEFRGHEPPLDLDALCTRTELGESGCLIEVIDEEGWVSLRVYFDEVFGDVYAVPSHVEWAEEMAELITESEHELRLWPHSGAVATPEPRRPYRCN